MCSVDNNSEECDYAAVKNSIPSEKTPEKS
jgi:hypothetical protein